MGKTFSYNTATLSGALDVIVIEHQDGTMLCSPFHVRFGKLKIFNSAQKTVNLVVNGNATPINMMLGKNGAAYFPNGFRESAWT
jgi:phosphatidate phosphatase LPIN